MKGDDNLPRELQELIDAYYAGKLSDDEARALRERVRAEPGLAAAARDHEALLRYGMRPGPEDYAERERLRAELRALQTGPPARVRPLRRYWIAGVAAAVLLALAVWLLVDRPTPEARLAAASFTWLPREDARLGPGERAEEGLAAYDAFDYARAYPLLLEGVQNGSLPPVNRLYAAVAALGDDRPAEARSLLAGMLAGGEFPLDEEAIRYYLGLAELQLGDRAAARTQLEVVAAAGPPRAAAARALLDRMDQLPQ